MPERANIDEYLEEYNPEMSKIALKLRSLILKMFPEINEIIKWKNLVYELNGYVCAILIHKAHINLEFWKGTELQDRQGRPRAVGYA